MFSGTEFTAVAGPVKAADSDPTDYPKAWLGLGQPGSGQTGGNIGSEAGVRVEGGIAPADGAHNPIGREA